MRKLAVVAATAALAFTGIAAADVKIGNKIPYENPGDVREAIRKECNLEQEMAEFLKDAAKGKGKGTLDAKITGVWAAGGPWGAGSIRVDAVLKDGGKSYKVASRRNTTRGGGACGKITVSARAVAEDIANWLESPVDDAMLGDLKKK